MVQITNAILIATAIAPAFAAPIGGRHHGGHVRREVLETREPRITSAQVNSIAKGANQIAHHLKSGVEFGATVAPLFQGHKREVEDLETRRFHGHKRELEDLETRKFHVTHSQLRAAGGAVAAAAGFAGTVGILNHQSQPQQPHRRELDENIEAREPRITSAQVNSFAKGANQIAHHIKNGIEFGTTVAPLFQGHKRELEDLETRKFHVTHSQLRAAGGAVAAAAGFAGTVGILNHQSQPHRRELDEGLIYPVARAYYDDEAELDVRDPKFSFGKVLKGVGKVAGAFLRREDEDGDLYLRELEAAELEARDPKFSFGKVLKGVGKVASFVLREDEDGLAAREFDDAELELDARDPKFNFGKVLKGVGKVASFVIREDEDDLSAREFDDAELELDARDPKFSFGKVLKGVGKVAGAFIRETPEFDELD